jgi:hypothetical protein
LLPPSFFFHCVPLQALAQGYTLYGRVWKVAASIPGPRLPHGRRAKGSAV